MTRVPPLRGLSPDFGRHAPSRSSARASSTHAARAAFSFFGYRLPRTVSPILNTPTFGLGGTSRSDFKICASIAHLVPEGEASAGPSGARAGRGRRSVRCYRRGRGGPAGRRREQIFGELTMRRGVFIRALALA